MLTKFAAALAAILIPLSLCTVAAPSASATPSASTTAPATTPAVGSVAVCLNIPLGLVWVSFCI